MSVLVTGGSKGVGRVTALRFAHPGVDVFINFHADEESARRTARDVEERGARAHLVRADVGTIEGAQQAVAAVAAVTDRLDLLVHCAVDATANRPSVLDIDPVAFARAVQCNASALLVMTQSARPLMREGSSVIFVSSRGSQAAVPGYAAVGAPKALGEAIMMYLAVELAADGIRANTVMGSAMDTQALRSALGDEAAEARLQWAAESSPSKRRIEIDELVDAIEFLASDRATMIRGQRLTVDGGFYLR